MELVWLKLVAGTPCTALRMHRKWVPHSGERFSSPPLFLQHLSLQQSPPSAAPAVQHPPPARRPCRRLALLAARRLPPAWCAAAAGLVASRARPSLVCGAVGGSAVRGDAGAGVTCKVAFFFLSAGLIYANVF